jgi:queuine tRNA-ribosyltransferase
VFELLGTGNTGRRGVLHTQHGTLQTPFFMPVGTVGAMKGLSFNDIEQLGAQVLLSNTYHLHLRPGDDLIAEAGGIHTFVNWQKPILTDSGGFQVFSFSKGGRCTIDDDGVTFQSHIDGRLLRMTPEDSMRIQHNIGADIIMCFDECPPSTASRSAIKNAVEKTLAWAKICKNTNEAYRLKNGKAPLLFGIVQGGLERDLREYCAQELQAIGFDGYAIGGLAVGESESEMYGVVQTVCPLLAPNKPRYLMGVGKRNQLQHCVRLGIDMFDCVLPMRIARHGTIILQNNEELRIKHSRFKKDFTALDEQSPSRLSKRHTKAYLHHLLKIGERYGETIATMQNLGVTLQTMQTLRVNIEQEIN